MTRTVQSSKRSPVQSTSYVRPIGCCGRASFGVHPSFQRAAEDQAAREKDLGEGHRLLREITLSNKLKIGQRNECDLRQMLDTLLPLLAKGVTAYADMFAFSELREQDFRQCL